MMTTKKSFGNRKFYSLPEEYPLRVPKVRSAHAPKKTEETSKLLKYIDENVIGRNHTFTGPYGRRKVVYCDYTASGRSLQFIEDYVLREVLPCYGNTHTTTSITSMQSTLFRHEARDIIRNAVHASEHDAVIFAGSGCTGAVHKLIQGLEMPEAPVVFVGPYEHHSNLLPWREIGAKIVRIAETREGFLDLLDLEQQLEAHAAAGRPLIGCFSAASNITGILADDVATTLLLHQYGALAFWDYAAAAPYVKLDMNPILPGVDETSVHKDAMFFSMHKFIGGVQTPGVLVAKKGLFRSDTPNGCGGGSVFFVTRESHRYLQDVELREEGGTAAVVESVRAGLVMQLKETVGVPSILAREQKIARMVLSHVRTIPELILLGSGSPSVKRLPIFSFLVRHPRGTFLHHNFVCAVLNDVFGIQARGGCACAGPYAQDLLGIDEDLALQYESVLLEDRRLDRTHLRRHEEHSNFEMLRPGFARISLPFFMGDAEVAFVMEALKMVATEAWKLLPQYILNPETGEWRHHTNSVFRERKWLGHIRYVDGKMTVNERRVSGCGTFPQEHADVLQTARNIFNKARKMAQRYPLADQCVMFDERTERLRWFMLPSEAQDLLLGNSHNVKHDVPFQPAVYTGSRGSVSEGSGLPATSAPSPVPPSPVPSPSPNGMLGHHAPPLRLASPRHSSLPCIDKQLVPMMLPYSDSCDGAFAPSVPPPPPLPPTTQGSLQQPVHLMRPLHFAVGEAVTPQPLLTSPLACSPVHTASAIPAHAFATSRTRCHSLGSSSQVSPPVLSPVTMANLGLVAPTSNFHHHGTQGIHGMPSHVQIGVGRRSCSSQTDLHSLDLGPASTSPMNSLGLLQLATSSINDCSSVGQGSPPVASSVASVCSYGGPSQSPEDLHAYVKEVTKELATEIKSEIREVISKVEDVLSDSGDCGHINGYEKTRSNSGSSAGGGESNGGGPPRAPSALGAGGPVSALEVAEYLMGMSREMASEMKSEIREMVSAVDCLISPDHAASGQHTAQCAAQRAAVAAAAAAAGATAAAAAGDTSPHSPRSPRSPRSPMSPLSAPATSPDPSSAMDVSSPGPASSASFINSKVADLAGERTQSSECSSDETVIHVMAAVSRGTVVGGGGEDGTATVGAAVNGVVGSGRSEASDDDEDADGWEDDAGSGAGGPGGKQALLMRSTINSVSSQDSGINLTFHESDSSSPGNTLAKDGAGAAGSGRRRKTNLSAVGAGAGVGSLQQLSRAALEGQRGRCDSNGACCLTRDEMAERSAVVSTTPGGVGMEAAAVAVVAEGPGTTARWHCPPKAIWKPAVEALQEFDMIRDGDRVIVCLSGGKDSLSLLHTLHQYQFYARAKGVHFTLGAATVDPGSTAYDPRPLVPYMESLGVEYLYEEQSILQQAAALDKCTSVCSFCSRMKRGRLYAAARKHGYNVLALGQHLDDLSESFLMSVFHNGRLRSMKAHYFIRERDLRVIRPFVYVREKALRQFAESRKLPIIPENCPACFEAPKERYRSKQLLAQQEILFPKLFWSLRSALHPLISFRYTGEESRQYMRHRKHSQSHSSAPAADADDSTDTDEEPVA